MPFQEAELAGLENTDNYQPIFPEDREALIQTTVQLHTGNIDIQLNNNNGLIYRNGDNINQLIKSESIRNQTNFLINLLTSYGLANIQYGKLRKSNRINSIQYGQTTYTREAFKRDIQFDNQNYITTSQALGIGITLNQFLQIRPDMKTEALFHELLKTKNIDALIDIKFDNIMIELLEMNGFVFKYNRQRYPYNYEVTQLIRDIGESYHTHYVESIKDENGKLIYLGKNVLYEVDNFVYCQGLLFNQLYVDGNGYLKYFNAGVDEFYSVEGKNVEFKDHVAELYDKKVKYSTSRGIHVQKRIGGN